MDQTRVNVSISSTTVTSSGVQPQLVGDDLRDTVWCPCPCGVVARMAITRPSGSTLIVAASTAPDFGRYSGLARNCGSSAVAT